LSEGRLAPGLGRQVNWHPVDIYGIEQTTNKHGTIESDLRVGDDLHLASRAQDEKILKSPG
jgi:hypothetical protein